MKNSTEKDSLESCTELLLHTCKDY